MSDEKGAVEKGRRGRGPGAVSDKPSSRARRRSGLLRVGVVAAVAIVAGAGFWCGTSSRRFATRSATTRWTPTWRAITETRALRRTLTR